MSLEKVFEPLKPYMRDPDEKDRLYSKGKKIEAVFLIEAANAILPRTEGVEDITLLKLPETGKEVPAILPQKLQAVARRRLLAHLRLYRDLHPEKLGEILKKLAEWYPKAEKVKDKPQEWNCFIQPSGAERKEKALDEGMDGFCPACILFGTVLTEKLVKVKDVSAGIKSRVEFDVAYAVVDKYESVMPITHNKVGEGLSFTGQSLYTERHVAPGTVFVGKAVLEDVTEAELKTFLAILAAVNRLGGMQSRYGTVRIHILGLRGGYYETVTTLEMAEHVIRKTGGTLAPASKVAEILEPLLKEYGFVPITSRDVVDLLKDWQLIDRLWEETLAYDMQVVEKLKEIYEAGSGKKQKQGKKHNK